MRKSIIFIVVLGLGIFGYSYFSDYRDNQALKDADFVEIGEYTCEDGKNIGVALADEIIRLSLYDKRVFTLEKVLADDESGTKFANDGEETVFWMKDNSAFLLENGTTTYSGCRTSNY